MAKRKEKVSINKGLLKMAAIVTYKKRVYNKNAVNPCYYSEGMPSALVHLEGLAP